MTTEPSNINLLGDAMNMQASIALFLAAVCFGMGFHIGWGLISLIVWVAAKSLGQPMPIAGPLAALLGM